MAKAATSSEKRPRGEADGDAAALAALARRHLRWGWWTLLVFLALGIALEAFHGFKLGWYLDVSASTRRLMWTLAHAHGTLLAVVHLALACTLRGFPSLQVQSVRLASPLLVASSVLLPGGFLVGGLDPVGGDPGLGIAGVALGGLLLLLAVLLVGRACQLADRAG